MKPACCLLEPVMVWRMPMTGASGGRPLGGDSIDFYHQKIHHKVHKIIGILSRERDGQKETVTMPRQNFAKGPCLGTSEMGLFLYIG